LYSNLLPCGCQLRSTTISDYMNRWDGHKSIDKQFYSSTKKNLFDDELKRKICRTISRFVAAWFSSISSFHSRDHSRIILQQLEKLNFKISKNFCLIKLLLFATMQTRIQNNSGKTKVTVVFLLNGNDKNSSINKQFLDYGFIISTIDKESAIKLITRDDLR